MPHYTYAIFFYKQGYMAEVYDFGQPIKRTEFNMKRDDAATAAESAIEALEAADRENEEAYLKSLKESK